MDSFESWESMPDFSFSLLKFRNAIAGTVRDKGVYPLRVIDLQETFDSEGGIAFHTPSDWNFHTVSHTWSMKIRELSEEVGKDVAKLGIGSSYEDVFRQTKLEDRPGYARLLEFLKIVQTDGVQRIWFDALCINQIDKKEKSREITHMGAFYYHSLGCYVVAHGFDKGFTLLKSNGELPRWFTRVWTLQEFVLPMRLTFIVELATEEFHVVVRRVRNAHKRGSCDCTGKTESPLWLWQSELGNVYSEFSSKPPPVQGEDEMEFWRQLESSGYRCTWGLFQRVADEGCSSNSTAAAERRVMYLVERDAYALLVMLLGGDALMSLELFASSGRSGGVVKEISVRDCSNEEDRVLAVLALLGLDGEMPQLRTGQTLAEQMVQMCSVMAMCNPKGLINLCAAFMRPLLGLLSLSWAPHFIAPKPPTQFHKDDAPMVGFFWAPRCIAPPTHEYHEDDAPIHSFTPLEHITVARVSVGPRGLSFLCHVLKGRLIPSLQYIALQCKKEEDCCTSLPASTIRKSDFVLQIVNGHLLCLNTYKGTHNQELVLDACKMDRAPHPHNRSDWFDGGVVLSTLDSHPIDCVNVFNRMQFSVWLLLLGSYTSMGDTVVLVFMVCVGEQADNLHKIGIVHMLPTYTINGGRSIIHLESFETMDCTLGGFGKREYHIWFVKQLHASCCWNFT